MCESFSIWVVRPLALGIQIIECKGIQIVQRALFSPEERSLCLTLTDTQPERTQAERPILARAHTHLL